MKKLYLISLIFFTNSAFSEKVVQHFSIRPTDPSIDLKSLSNNNVTVLEAYDQNSYKSNLPSIEKRDKAFEECGISEQIKNWDDFEKDSLYIKLSNPGANTINLILKKYPDFSRKSLEKAQMIISDQEAI